MDTPIPTTYADLTAAGWEPGAGPAGYRFRSIVIGDYEIVVHTDGGGVSLYRRDSAIQISEADAVALATKIAALLRGGPGADLTAALAERDAAHAALDEAGAPAGCGVLSERISLLAADRDQANRFLDSLVKERDTLRADLAEDHAALEKVHAKNARLAAALTEAGTVNSRLAADLARTQSERDTLRQQLANTLAANNAVVEALLLAGFRERDTTIADDIRALVAERDTLRARLAERPAPPDYRDPPVSTAAEEATERLWGTLYALGGDLNRADFADGIEGIADAVEAALSLNLEQIHTLTDERDHATNLAMEQFRHRLYRT